jgi:hypothetical protein
MVNLGEMVSRTRYERKKSPIFAKTASVCKRLKIGRFQEVPAERLIQQGFPVICRQIVRSLPMGHAGGYVPAQR